MPNRKFSYSNPFENEPEGIEKLSKELRIFVPSTQKQIPITTSDLENREKEIEDFFKDITAGFTKDDEIGEFNDIK